jgi:DnaK suppressor protein
MLDNRKSIRHALKVKMSEYVATANLRDSIQIEQVSDLADITQQATEREVATQSLSRQAAILRQLRSAIERIDIGSYGVCLQCEEQISLKRLVAIPWAEYCITCQEIADHSIRNAEVYGGIGGRIGAA